MMKFQRDAMMTSFLLFALLACCSADNVDGGDVIKRNFRQKTAERISHGFGKRAEENSLVNIESSLDQEVPPITETLESGEAVLLQQNERILPALAEENDVISNINTSPRDTAATNQQSDRWVARQVHSQPMALSDDRNQMRTFILSHLAQLRRNWNSERNVRVT